MSALQEAIARKRAEIGDDPERLAKLDSLVSQFQAQQYDEQDWTEEFRGLAAIPAEAMSLGILGDEVRAAGRAAILSNTDTGGTFKEEYELALADEKRVEAETYRDYPIAAYGAQLAFGLAPAVKIGAAVGLGKTALSGAARQGAGAAAEGAVYGFMEGDDGDGRLTGAAKAAAFAGVLGGAGGAVAGRFSPANAKVQAKAQAQRDVAQDALAKEAKNVPTEELGEAVNRKMTERAAKLWQEDGVILQGSDYIRNLNQVAKELGVKAQDVRKIQGLKFFEEKEFIEKLDDYVPGHLSRKEESFVKTFYRNAMQPVVKKAEQLVGKSFAGKMQRYATRMAQRGDEISTFFRQEEVQAFGRLLQGPESAPLRSHLLNMSNLNLDDGLRGAEYVRLRNLIKEQGGEKAWKGFQTTQRRLMQEQGRQNKRINSFIEPDPLYWPAQYKQQGTALRGRDNASRAKQNNMMTQERKFISPEQAMMYENPLIQADDWMRASAGLSEMFETFGLQNARAAYMGKMAAKGKTPSDKQLSKAAEKARQQVAGGEWAFTSLRERLIAEGADPKTAENGVSMMRAVAVDGSRGPNRVVSNFRKAAYMGTIGNPYSAVLNVGDVFNSAVNFGTKNTVKAVYDSLRGRGLRVSADDVGMMHQTTGEFIRDGAEGAQIWFDKLSEATFDISQFRRFDKAGKSVAMNASIKQNQQRAKSTAEFAKRWNGIFSPAEQRQLRRDILRGKKSQLVKEMAAAELSKMQPTDMANLPQWFLEHPNARVLWMLRTFGLKQIQQMDELIVKQWKEGNKKQAVRNALVFSAYTGGGNAVIQEGRQALKGDAPNFSLDSDDKGLGYRFADHMLGAATANTFSLYSLDMAKKRGSASPLVEGALPPLAMAFAPIVDAMSLANAEDIDVQAALHESEVIGWLPWGRLAQSWLDDDE